MILTSPKLSQVNFFNFYKLFFEVRMEEGNNIYGVHLSESHFYSITDTNHCFRSALKSLKNTKGIVQIKGVGLAVSLLH